MKPLFFLIGIVITTTLVLAAQDDGSSEPRTERGRLAWFIYTSMPEGLENPVNVMSGKDLVEITLSKRSPSQPVKIPADGVIRLVRQAEEPLEPGQAPYLTLAQATIPEGVNQALVILIPAAKTTGDQLFQTKIQDLAKFKGGDWLFLNLTKLNIGIDMGSTKLPLKPGRTLVYESPDLTEPTSMPIRYSYFHPTHEEWKMLSASTIVLHATRREICIFSVDPRFERVQYHGITFPVLN